MTDHPKTAILGGGVIGLSVALRLAREGFPVTVITQPLGPTDPPMTSLVAAAYWFPTHKQLELELQRELTLPTFEHFWSLMDNAPGSQNAGSKDAGVSMVDTLELFDDTSLPEQREPAWWMGDEQTRDRIGFHGPVDEKTLPAPTEQLGTFVQGYRYKLPVISMPRYMPWLYEQFVRQGGDVRDEQVRDVAALKDEFDLIVNTTGLGARKLTFDGEPLDRARPETFHTLIGQVMAVRDVWYPTLTFMRYGMGAKKPTYIVPRAATKDVVLGGTYLPLMDDPEQNIDIDDGCWTVPKDQWTADILERAAILHPDFAKTKDYHVLVGKRPYRKPLRLEVDEQFSDDKLTLIHCYGHSTSGVTMSWGSGEKVLAMLNDQ